MNEISQTPLAYAPAPNWLVIALIILIVMLFKIKDRKDRERFEYLCSCLDKLAGNKKIF
jgi:hypothetical protein